MSAAVTGVESSAARLGWVDVLRGLLVLAVVVGHVEYLMSWHIGEAFLVPAVSALLQPVRMPALFFVSGALFASYQRRPWSLVLVRRVLPLAWVLLVWLTVQGLVLATVGALPDHSPGVILPFVVEQLWLPDDYLWFIWALIVMSLVARLVRSRWLALVAGIAFLWSATTSLPEVLELGKQSASFLRAAPLFLVGVTATNWLRTPVRRVLALLPAGAAVFAAHLAFPEVVAEWSPRLGQAWLLLVALAGAVCLVCLSAGLARTPLRVPLVAVGQRTLTLYLVHMPITLLAVWVVATHFRDRAAGSPTLVTVAVVAVVAVVAGVLPKLLSAVHVGGVLGLPRWTTRLLQRWTVGGDAAGGAAGRSPAQSDRAATPADERVAPPAPGRTRSVIRR